MAGTLAAARGDFVAAGLSFASTVVDGAAFAKYGGKSLDFLKSLRRIDNLGKPVETTGLSLQKTAARTYELAADAAKQLYFNLGRYGRLNDVYQLLPKGGIALVETAGQVTKKMKLLAYADNAFQRSLAYYSRRGITDASQLGTLAGRRAEKMVSKWAADQGYRSVRTGDVPIGIGKFSSDGKWSPGKFIFDFKKSKGAIGGEQSSAFKMFAEDLGYTVYYIIGR